MTQQKKKKKLDRKTQALLIACVSLAFVSLACFGAWQWLAHLLDSQRAAERWQAGGDMAFSQVSCFLPSNKQIELGDVAAFRNAAMKKLQEASLDITNGAQLMRDGWSTKTKLYTSGNHGRGEASVIAVGGDFFDFHPLQLLSGDYIRQSDLMHDRIVLGENVAWMLFGGTDLAGMTMELNGLPFVIAGVVAQEDDFASRKANSEDLDLYMSYDALLQIDENAKINCYEVLLAEPVKGFALGVVKDKFPIGTGEIICNTTRYDFGKMADLILHFGTRGSEVSGAALPYWENAARTTEDWGALCVLMGSLLAIFPAVLFVICSVRIGRYAKTRLEDEIWPEVREATEEAVRIRQRRRWERKYGKNEKR